MLLLSLRPRSQQSQEQVSPYPVQDLVERRRPLQVEGFDNFSRPPFDDNIEIHVEKRAFASVVKNPVRKYHHQLTTIVLSPRGEVALETTNEV